MKPPLCVYCGGAIRKRTTTVWVRAGGRRAEHGPDSKFSRHIFPVTAPTTIAECRRLTNLTVTAVTRSADGKTITRFHEWDGESYEDRFFCNGDHARRFAYVMAGEGRCMPEYNAAVRARAATASEPKKEASRCQ